MNLINHYRYLQKSPGNSQTPALKRQDKHPPSTIDVRRRRKVDVKAPTVVYVPTFGPKEKKSRVGDEYAIHLGREAELPTGGCKTLPQFHEEPLVRDGSAV